MAFYDLTNSEINNGLNKIKRMKKRKKRKKKNCYKPFSNKQCVARSFSVVAAIAVPSRTFTYLMIKTEQKEK